MSHEAEYDLAVERLNDLLDKVGDDEQHPLYDLLNTLGLVIEAYEATHHPIPDCPPEEILQFLMTEHQLRLSDLPELGTSDAVSAILDGQQPLTIEQVRALSKRFQVSPAVLI